MIFDVNNETKICSKCKKIKPFSEYYKCTGSPHGITSKCKACTEEHKKNQPSRKKQYGKSLVGRKQSALRRESSQDRKFQKQLNKEDAFIEKEKARLVAQPSSKKKNRVSRSKPADKANLRPETYAREHERKKRYKREHPEIVRAIDKSQRSKRRQVSIECSTAETKMFMEENTCCAQCGSTDKLTLDHIIPISWGILSRHGLDNFQVLCNKCNGTKGANWSIDFRPHESLDQINVLGMLK